MHNIPCPDYQIGELCAFVRKIVHILSFQVSSDIQTEIRYIFAEMHVFSGITLLKTG